MEIVRKEIMLVLLRCVFESGLISENVYTYVYGVLRSAAGEAVADGCAQNSR